MKRTYCSVHPCRRLIDPKQFMCSTHWAMVPDSIKSRFPNGPIQWPLDADHVQALLDALDAVNAQVGF